jgi:hypothetical protein
MSCISITVAYKLSPQNLVPMKNINITDETAQNIVSNKVQDFRELGVESFLCPFSEYTLLLFLHVFLLHLLCALLEEVYALGELGFFV